MDKTNRLRDNLIFTIAVILAILGWIIALSDDGLSGGLYYICGIIVGATFILRWWNK